VLLTKREYQDATKTHRSESCVSQLRFSKRYQIQAHISKAGANTDISILGRGGRAELLKNKKEAIPAAKNARESLGWYDRSLLLTHSEQHDGNGTTVFVARRRKEQLARRLLWAPGSQKGIDSQTCRDANGHTRKSRFKFASPYNVTSSRLV
jgi:hypothetical protein